MPDRILYWMNIGYVSVLEKCVLILVEERLDFVGHVPGVMPEKGLNRVSKIMIFVCELMLRFVRRRLETFTKSKVRDFKQRFSTANSLLHLCKGLT